MIYRAPENTARLLRKRRKKNNKKPTQNHSARYFHRPPSHKGAGPGARPRAEPRAPQPTLLLNFRAAAASSVGRALRFGTGGNQRCPAPGPGRLNGPLVLSAPNKAAIVCACPSALLRGPSRLRIATEGCRGIGKWLFSPPREKLPALPFWSPTPSWGLSPVGKEQGWV